MIVTSYQLAVQDAFAFKRKKWYYMILDEAQNIKNFQSQRWQTLINFNTQRRLLLTGTPLQVSFLDAFIFLRVVTWDVVVVYVSHNDDDFLARSLVCVSSFVSPPSLACGCGRSEQSDGIVVSATFFDAVRVSIEEGIFVLVPQSFERYH